MASLREEDTIALRDHLEMALASLGRDGRRIHLFLLLEDLGLRVNEAPRGETRKENHLLENLHLGFGLTISTLLGLGLSHTVTNTDQLSIDIFQTSLDATLDRLLDLDLDKTRGEWLESLVEKIVDGELERATFA